MPNVGSIKESEDMLKRRDNRKTGASFSFTFSSNAFVLRQAKISGVKPKPRTLCCAGFSFLNEESVIQGLEISDVLCLKNANDVIFLENIVELNLGS